MFSDTIAILRATRSMKAIQRGTKSHSNTRLEFEDPLYFGRGIAQR